MLENIKHLRETNIELYNKLVSLYYMLNSMNRKDRRKAQKYIDNKLKQNRHGSTINTSDVSQDT